MVAHYQEGTVNFVPGKKIVTSFGTYQLAKKQRIEFADWRGAGATILIQNPLRPKDFVPYGPALEENDIETAASETLTKLATRYHALIHPRAELTEPDARERDQLAEIFEPEN